MRLGLVTLFGLFLVSSAADVARAQTPVEEITVTAQGRAEPLFALPGSAAAFDAAGIAAGGLETLDRLGLAVPGLWVIDDQDPGTNIVTLRGVSTDRLQAPAIVYLVDGIPLPDPELFTQALYGLDRIAVFKGPQGALFGRNAAGGAIAVTTSPAPAEMAEGALTLDVGSGEGRSLQAGFGTPLGARAGIAASLLAESRAGEIDNRTLGRPVDYRRQWGGRLRLDLAPSERLSLDLSLTGLSGEHGAAWVSSGDVSGDFDGRLAGAALTDPIGDFLGRADRDWWRAASRARLDLGWATLSASLAADRYEKDWSEELDFRPGPVSLFGAPLFPDGIQPVEQPVDLAATTAELRLTSPDDRRLRWTLGGFRSDTQRRRVDRFGPLLFGAEPPEIATESSLSAVFAALAVDLTETVELRFALRHDSERLEEISEGERSGAGRQQAEARFDRWQPRLALSWRPDERWHLYSVYSEGSKAGGFNPEPGPSAIFARSYPAEVVRGVELGAKARLFDGRLAAEAALFASDAENRQIYTFIDGRSVTLSAPEATIRGAELSLAARPMDWLTVSASWSAVDAQIDRLTTPDPLGGPAPRDYAGAAVPNSPAWQARLGAQATAPITDGLTLTAGLDASLVGRVYYEIDNVLYSPAHEQVDARLTVAGGAWSVSLRGRNLFDRRRAISAFGQGMLPLLQGLGPGGPFDSFTLAPGRGWAVEASWRF